MYTVFGNYQDVYITSGCSDALRVAIDCIGDTHKNILLPKPGFSLYQTICGNRGIPVKFYNLIVSSFPPLILLIKPITSTRFIYSLLR